MCAVIVIKNTKRNPFLAALLSLIIPGSGQAYNGQWIKSILILVTFWLIIPWIYGVLDAYLVARKINKGKIKITSSSFSALWYIFIFVLIAIVVQHLLQARVPANERIAIETLKEYHRQQESLKEQNYAYANFPSSEKKGYRFSTLNVTKDAYKIKAEPIKPYVTGFRIFTIDETGTIISENSSPVGHTNNNE